MTGGRRGGRGGNRLVLALATAACALTAIAGAAAAADSTETSIFGSDGIATQSLGMHFLETGFSSVEALPGGGLVAVRRHQFGNEQLESFLANGAPDPGAPPRRVSASRKIFPLAGGKSLVRDEFSLTRVNPDGSVDTSFDGDGTIELPWQPLAAAELPSGKVLVAGTIVETLHAASVSVAVKLINPDGSVNRGAGTEDARRVPFNPENSRLPEIALTGDGGALVVGGRFLLELRADGSPNRSFGTDGLVDEGLPQLVGARVLPDGSIEAVGSGPGSSDEDLLVLRYTAAGTPDSGFGPNGIRSFDFGGIERARVASWGADGSAIVGGTTEAPGLCQDDGSCEEAPIVAAFDPNGGLDPGFGERGALRLAALAAAPRSYEGGVAALTRRPDGSIVAAGAGPPLGTVAFLAAFSTRGSLLPDFGEGGFVRARQGVRATQSVAGFAPSADGRLLAAGTTDAGFDYTPVLIRYAADGSLDRSFGSGAGYVPVDSPHHFARGFAANSSGQVLIGVAGFPRDKLLELRADDGAPVPSFGSGGTVLLPNLVRVAALDLEPDGSAIVIGNHATAGPGEPGVVLRFGPNGKPDPEFGHGGEVALRLRGGKKVRARALSAVSRGGLLVGGVAGRRFALTKLHSDGTTDARFGLRGWSLAPAGGEAKSALLRQVGSRTYLAGVARDRGRLRLSLLRFGKDGQADLGFGQRGRCTAPISDETRATAIVPSRRGVLVVLSEGTKPLLQFGPGCMLRRHSLGASRFGAENVRTTLADGRLLLGWNSFSPAEHRYVYHLASRRLP